MNSSQSDFKQQQNDFEQLDFLERQSVILGMLQQLLHSQQHPPSSSINVISDNIERIEGIPPLHLNLENKSAIHVDPTVDFNFEIDSFICESDNHCFKLKGKDFYASDVFEEFPEWEENSYPSVDKVVYDEYYDGVKSDFFKLQENQLYESKMVDEMLDSDVNEHPMAEQVLYDEYDDDVHPTAQELFDKLSETVGNNYPIADRVVYEVDCQISEDDKLNLKSEMVVEHNLDNFRAKFLSTSLSLGCILSQLLSFLVLMIPRLVGY
ncbi:hypothetical protein Leryth_024586 [Lithospermum erythrorhizon]|nr:hypothetical protein Leryth_024586 [Lithospermum erythrorhizon]